jgi:hypothetical protein
VGAVAVPVDVVLVAVDMMFSLVFLFFHVSLIPLYRDLITLSSIFSRFMKKSFQIISSSYMQLTKKIRVLRLSQFVLLTGGNYAKAHIRPVGAGQSRVRGQGTTLAPNS